MSRRRTPIPLSLVTSRVLAAIAHGALPHPGAGVHGLAIRHDDWCMSQKARTHNWCDCTPEPALEENLTPDRYEDLMRTERRRKGLDQHRDN